MLLLLMLMLLLILMLMLMMLLLCHVATSHFGTTGLATAVGEQPIKGR